MSWCDKLASTAGAGFRLDHHFAPAETVLNALSPLIDPLVSNDKEQFTLERLEGFVLSLSTFEGFRYAAEPSIFAVTFNHRLRPKLISGGPPTMEMLSSPLPFTKLLPRVSEKLMSGTLLLPGSKTRKIKRVGIISLTHVAHEEIPPGIDRFMKLVGRPWKNALDAYRLEITAEINKTDAFIDRCIHTITRPEDKEQLTTLNFDWQRSFTVGKAIARDSMEEILKSAEKSALAYFEDVAEGNRFDEDIISPSARG